MLKSLVVSGNTSRFWEADSWGEVGRKIVNQLIIWCGNHIGAHLVLYPILLRAFLQAVMVQPGQGKVYGIMISFCCLTMTSEVIDNYIQDVLRPASISFPFVPITIQVLLYMMFHFFSLYWNNLAVIPTLLQYKGTIRFLHRTGKGQFSLQSQRKEMQKNAQTTAQLHSSHTLVK